ncbi:MAG: dTDP-glucose 4,6-dehydratase [Acidobacteriota bacterium]
MQRLIVTGGAGFIGANFVRGALDHSDAEVVVFDKLTYAGSLENLADVASHKRYHFVEGDIADREAVRQLLDTHRPTAILNFAAESHVDRSIDGPQDFIDTNIVGTFVLLEAARAYAHALSDEMRRAFRFLHVSTDEVYGSLGQEGYFVETTPYAPNSPYAASKAAADHLVRAWGETYGLPVLITNCSNNYGPFQYPEKLIPLMILNAVEAKNLPIYGDGSNVRDWLYVGDHCAGILRVLEQGRPGEKYNLGGDAERTNVEVVTTLCDLVEAERPATENPHMTSRGLTSYRDLITYVKDRPGHDQRYAIDASKMRGELGWTPQHDFASGLRDTVRWYLANETWCRAVQAGRNARSRIGLGD